MYYKDVDTWLLYQTLQGSSQEDDHVADIFGFSLSLNSYGTQLMIGSPCSDSGSDSGQGSPSSCFHIVMSAVNLRFARFYPDLIIFILLDNVMNEYVHNKWNEKYKNDMIDFSLQVRRTSTFVMAVATATLVAKVSFRSRNMFSIIAFILIVINILQLFYQTL